MGAKLSSEKYSLEIAHLCSYDGISPCCSVGENDFLLSDNTGYFIFKEKFSENPKWILYQGVLKNILLRTQELYLLSTIRMDDTMLEENSLVYENFFNLLQYVNNDIKNDMFSMKVICYNNNNIKSNYINEVLE